MQLTPRRIGFLLLSFDLSLLVILFNAIGYVRRIIPAGEFILVPLLLPCAIALFSIYLIDGYRSRTDMLSVDYTSQHCLGLAAALLAVLLVIYVFAGDHSILRSSRGVVILSFGIFALFSISYRRMFSLRALKSRKQTSIIFLGDTLSCIAFQDECAGPKINHPVVYSVFDERHPTGVTPLRGEFRSFSSVLKDVAAGLLPVEAVVIHESAHQLQADDTETLMGLHARGIPTYTLDLFYQAYWHKIPLSRLNQIWLFQEGFQITRDGVFARVKRICDVSLAGFTLLLLSPVLGLVMLAIKIDDGGPVFFSQTRIGKNRLRFKIYKFRSMRLEKPREDERYTRPGDRRITRIGHLLRSTRLDEFPQLWNVLKGDMSMIGPRAEWDLLVDDYENKIPCYNFRHLVKPGITGWAQINYPYGANLDDTLRKLEYDLYYIKYYSFLLDASIVLKTIHVMLFGKGR